MMIGHFVDAKQFNIWHELVNVIHQQKKGGMVQYESERTQ